MNVSLSSLLFTVGIFILSFTGCYDNPDPVGIGMFSESDLALAQIDTFYATHHTSTESFIYTQNLDRVMLGIYTTSDNWTYEAWTCLKFFQWPDSLLGATIDNASIQLKTINTFGNSVSPLTFSVYRARLSWSGDSLSYDSLQYPSIYYDGNPILTQTSEDTGWVNILVLDTSMVRSWFISNTDTSHLNDGLIFRPTNTDIIKAFYSFNNYDETVRPRFVVSYEKNGMKGTYIHSYLTSRFVSNIIPPSSVQIDADSMIYVQNGFSYHGNIWFDTFKLPRSSIYSASLEMTLDESSTRIFEHDSLYAFLTKTDGTIDWNYYLYYGGIWGSPLTTSTGKHKYKFEVRNFMSSWKNGVTIPKIIIAGKNENLSFDLFKLYGSASSIPQELRPRLIITYDTKR